MCVCYIYMTPGLTESVTSIYRDLTHCLAVVRIVSSNVKIEKFAM